MPNIYLPPLRLDRDLYHSVGLGREELVSLLDLVEREPVRD